MIRGLHRGEVPTARLTEEGNSRPPWWCPIHAPTKLSTTPVLCRGTWYFDLRVSRKQAVTPREAAAAAPRQDSLGHAEHHSDGEEERPHKRLQDNLSSAGSRGGTYVGVDDPVEGHLGVDVYGVVVLVRERCCERG